LVEIQGETFYSWVSSILNSISSVSSSNNLSFLLGGVGPGEWELRVTGLEVDSNRAISHFLEEITYSSMAIFDEAESEVSRLKFCKLKEEI